MIPKQHERGPVVRVVSKQKCQQHLQSLGETPELQTHVEKLIGLEMAWGFGLDYYHCHCWASLVAQM